MANIKKKYHLFVWAVLTATPLNIWAMHTSKEYLKNLGKYTASLAVGALCSYEYISLYKKGPERQRKRTKIVQDTLNNPQPKSEAFVIKTLHTAFPELKNRKTCVVTGTKKHQWQFATCHYNDAAIIFVPFDDKELAAAQRIYEKIKKGSLGLTLPYATLDLWQGIIVHEGSHILHNDGNNKVTSYHALTPYILYACIKNCKTFSPVLLGSALALRGVSTFLYAYLQEYRADQETIQRTQDPAILRAMSIHLGNSSLQTPTLASKINYLFDKHSTTSLAKKFKYLFNPHPDDTIRAAYFAKAAEEIEKKSNISATHS